MADLSTTDLAVRRAVYARFAAGGAPALAEVAVDLAMARDAVRASYERLALAHVLVLDPDTRELRMAMPFSAVPTAFRVDGLGRQWFANCAWDAFGIAAALSCDVIITTGCLDCRAELIYGIRAGRGHSRGALCRGRRCVAHAADHAGLLDEPVVARPSWDDMTKSIVVSLLLTAVLTGSASAQSSPGSFQAGAQITAARSGEFDSTEFGIGGRLSWHPMATLGLESEIDLYPADFPADSVPFSAARLEALFGVTAGPRLTRVRPFARIRAGFLRYSPPTEGFACIAIFPPPLNCLMAAGGTRSIFDVGGGIEVFTGSRTFMRVDVGDRMVRLPAPTLTDGFTLRETAFFSHDVRFSIGGGIRF